MLCAILPMRCAVSGSDICHPAPGPTANSSRPPSRTSSAERTHSSHHSGNPYFLRILSEAFSMCQAQELTQPMVGLRPEHRHPSYLDPTSSSSSAKAGQDPKARGRHSHSSTQGHGPRRGSLSRTASNDSGSRPAEKPVEVWSSIHAVLIQTCRQC